MKTPEVFFIVLRHFHGGPKRLWRERSESSIALQASVQPIAKLIW
jgi:hypothetical protein